jgi:hypothetical protein
MMRGVTLELYQAAKAMMVCAPAWKCPKEEACFNMSKSIIDAWEQEEHSAALTRAEAAESVADYSPHLPPATWEWHPDWDAA